jgi:hypothetical protein
MTPTLKPLVSFGAYCFGSSLAAGVFLDTPQARAAGAILGASGWIFQRNELASTQFSFAEPSQKLLELVMQAAERAFYLISAAFITVALGYPMPLMAALKITIMTEALVALSLKGLTELTDSCLQMIEDLKN